MRKKIFLILKIVGGTLGVVILLLVVATFALNTKSVQNRLMQYATEQMTEKLHTKVVIDSVSVSLFSQSVQLDGVDIEDQQQRKMFQMEHLSVNLEVWPLLKNEVRISKARIKGLSALLIKAPEDSVANYQFILDSLKSSKPQRDSIKAQEKKKEGKKTVLDIKRVTLEDIKVQYNSNVVSLASLDYKKNHKGKQKAHLTGVSAGWQKVTKKGVTVDYQVAVDAMDYDEEGETKLISIDSLRFQSDNHLPRKNKGKPNRGAFDVGHLNLAAQLNVTISRLEKDTIEGELTKGMVVDPSSGINLTDLRFKVATNKKVAHLKDIVITQGTTALNIDEAELVLPSKKENRLLSYSTSTIKSRVLLKDISRPFAPVLKGFTMPLDLQVKMNGNDDGMSFRDISVSSADKRLMLTASGGIKNLKDKYALDIRFHVNKMVAKNKVKQDIINLFPVKKFMMTQLDAMGTITFVGDVIVLYKREAFRGKLGTQVGDLTFDFALDERNKYVLGKVHTDSVHLGKAFQMDDLGKVACNAEFKFDISKPRTAKMRKLKGGKLPIGEVDALVSEATYKKIHVRNVQAKIVSDGAQALGDLAMKGKRTDILCSFTFTNTDAMKKMKIKPGIRFHKLSEEDKQAKETQKQQKAEEKAQRKQEKAEEKAQRKQEKAEEKALRKQQKAEEKARKKAEKERRKQEKNQYI